MTGGFDPNTAFSTSNGYQLLATFGAWPQLVPGGYGGAVVDTAAGLIDVSNYESANGKIMQEYQSSGAYALVDSFALPFGFPSGLAIDPVGKKLYASDTTDSNVAIVSTTRAHALLGVVSTGFSYGVLAVDSLAQRWYAGGRAGRCATNGIEAFSTVPPYRALMTAATDTRPLSIAVDSGKLYVEDYRLNDPHPNLPNGYIDVYSTTDLHLLGSIGPFPYPAGEIALDAVGRRLYVLVPRENVSPFNSTVQAYALDAGLSYLGSFTATANGVHLAAAPSASVATQAQADKFHR